MVNKMKDETTIVWANTGLVGQPQTVRFPRARGIRSLYFFHDFALDVDTAITEFLSALEAIGTINIEWGGTTLPGMQEPAHEINVRGDEIAITQLAHFGTTPLVGHAAYRDLPVADDQDFDAVYRLPCGASPSPQQNINIRVDLSGEAVWCETVADAPADLDSVLYIVADYVDVLNVSWDTWDDNRPALAAQVELQPPAKGNTIFGFSVVCRDDDALYTAMGTAGVFETYSSNYEEVLTTVEIEVGEEVISLGNGTPIVCRAANIIHRRQWNLNAVPVLGYPVQIDMCGNYWFDCNLLANSLPRIRLNAATTDARILVWYSTPVLAAPTAAAVQGAGATQGEGRPQSGQASAQITSGPVYQPAGQTVFQPVLAQSQGPNTVIGRAGAGLGSMISSVGV